MNFLLKCLAVDNKSKVAMSRRQKGHRHSGREDVASTNTQRISVFERLGPPPAENRTVLVTVKRLQYYQNENRPRDHHGNHQPPTSTPTPTRSSAAAKQSTSQPIHHGSTTTITAATRTTTTILRDAGNQHPRSITADLVVPTTPKKHGVVLEQLYREKESAEELAQVLMMGQDSLLKDKNKLQTENAKLQQEVSALRERLDFLQPMMMNVHPCEYVTSTTTVPVPASVAAAAQAPETMVDQQIELLVDEHRGIGVQGIGGVDNNNKEEEEEEEVGKKDSASPTHVLLRPTYTMSPPDSAMMRAVRTAELVVED